MKSIEVALFELRVFKISLCLNAHEKHVGLQQWLARIQRSPVKNFLFCFVQHGALHCTTRYWMKIFRDKEWQSVEVITAKLQEFFHPILLKPTNFKCS